MLRAINNIPCMASHYELSSKHQSKICYVMITVKLSTYILGSKIELLIVYVVQIIEINFC